MEKINELIFNALIILFSCIIGLTAVAQINRYEYKNCELISCIEYEYNGYVPNKDEIKADVDKLFPYTKYILRNKQMKAGVSGYTYLILKLIYIDPDLSEAQFALVLTHELVHINHFTGDERYTSFKTFEILYESDNDYFRAVAMEYANQQLSNRYPHAYDCSGYIEEYLLNNQN